MGFDFLGLSDALLSAVKESGYTEPTPIQAQAIPSVLQGRDILGIAQTGTGKTASFTLPMIDILAEGRARARMPRSLILEPTRELAAQVADNFTKYGQNHKLTMALLIGGVSFADQESALDKGVDVLIATPGRLLDHFERGKLMLNGVQILVVDEADRMLDMGFIPDVERICSLMPQRHQSLFFSATMPPEVKRLTDRFLDDPKFIEVARPSSTAATVKQSVVHVAPRDKTKALRDLASDETLTNAIVFCNRKRDIQMVYTSLKRAGFKAGQLHGDMSQPERMDMLAAFKNNELSLLVASDVAARGLDISTVSHVFNFDVPTNAEDYVHRIGRTGRAGRSGVAVTLATREDAKYVAAIEKLIGQKISVVGADAVAETDSDMTTVETEAQSERQDNHSEAKPDGKRSRRGGRGKPRKEDQPSSDKEKPRKAADNSQEKETRKSSPRDERPKKGGKGGRDRGRRQDKQDDDAVVGLGDHVPAFLMTSTKTK